MSCCQKAFLLLCCCISVEICRHRHVGTPDRCATLCSGKLQLVVRPLLKKCRHKANALYTMCTTLFMFDVHPGILFLLTFNRDEFFDR